MSQSNDQTMRLERVEDAIVQIAKILVEQSERVDSGFNRVHRELDEVRGEISSVRGEISSVRSEVSSVRSELQTTREALTERLDRLIAVTMQERTLGIERLAELERRLARLEAHAGF